MKLVLPTYNTHPNFSLKNLGKKRVHYTQKNMVPCEQGIPLPREINENICPHNQLHMNVHNRIIYNNQK